MSLLGSVDISDPTNIASFARSEAAAYTGSGDSVRLQREAASGVLRDEHYVGVSANIGPLVLLEDEPTPCVLIAPGNPTGTDNGNGTCNLAWDDIPILASAAKYQWRLTSGVWTDAGSNTVSNVSATAGTYVLQVRAVSTSGVAGDVAYSAPFTVSVSTSSFVTAQTIGTLRNDFTGRVGFRFTVGASPITITSLGRWVVAGNSTTHLVQIFDAIGTLMASATIPTSGQPANAYSYVAASGTLAALTEYNIVGDEDSSGDQWSDDNDILAATAGTITASVFASGHGAATFGVATSGSVGFGPYNFQF